MRFRRSILLLLLAASLVGFWACRREYIVSPGQPVDPPLPPKPAPTQENLGRLPDEYEGLPSVYIDTPGGCAITSKHDWVELSTIKITVKVHGEDSVAYQADSLKIKGRGNSTWLSYPKKPYSLKLNHKANFLGTGKTTRWCLLANWMDRTCLRNDVAFEAARRTRIEWTPSGVFVNLFLNGEYRGMYWLGERIHVEGSNFDADYLYSFDTSDGEEKDFVSKYGRWSGGHKDGGIPVEVKYPDKDDYKEDPYALKRMLFSAQSLLEAAEADIYHPSNWKGRIDLDSFCDYFLVNELCSNTELRHPKSCFMYMRDGKLYAGPIWDFDWGTFPYSDDGKENRQFVDKNTVFFHQLLPQPEFKEHLKRRWLDLKPAFMGLLDYIDKQAAHISEAEALNHIMWPCYPNPLAGSDENYMVNQDENLTYTSAVNKMKKSLVQRIDNLDGLIMNL